MLVSNLGRCITPTGVKSYGSNEANGYVRFKRSASKYMAHRVVAWGFLGRPPTPRHTVDHIDGNSRNNAASNLRYATASEQQLYVRQSGTRSAGNTRKRPVIRTNVLTMERIRFDSATAAGESVGASQAAISAACLGARRGVNEYRFEYEQTVVTPLENECWSAIVFGDIDTNWRVSNYGRLLTSDGQLVKPKPQRSGYVRVRVKHKLVFVHRLVANAFLPVATDSSATVDHIDRDKTNNRADNLRWCTPSQQVQHALAAGREATTATTKPVEYRKIGAPDWLRANSAKELAAALGLKVGSIQLAAQLAGPHGGYQFRYEEMPDLPGEVWCEVDLDEIAQFYQPAKQTPDEDVVHAAKWRRIEEEVVLE